MIRVPILNPDHAFQLKKKKGFPPGERVIQQYHYTTWPDHGVPSHTLPVLRFIKKSADSNPADGGPVIAHCRQVVTWFLHAA